MVEMFIVGKIVNTHGIKGELRVLPTTDDSSRFKQLKTVYVENKEISEYEIEAVRLHKTFVLIKLKGIDDMDSAQMLKGSILKIDRKDSLPLKEDEYYISDLYGLRVVTEDGKVYGWAMCLGSASVLLASSGVWVYTSMFFYVCVCQVIVHQN